MMPGRTYTGHTVELTVAAAKSESVYDSKLGRKKLTPGSRIELLTDMWMWSHPVEIVSPTTKEADDMYYRQREPAVVGVIRMAGGFAARVYILDGSPARWPWYSAYESLVFVSDGNETHLGMVRNPQQMLCGAEIFDGRNNGMRFDWFHGTKPGCSVCQKEAARLLEAERRRRAV